MTVKMQFVDGFDDMPIHNNLYSGMTFFIFTDQPRVCQFVKRMRRWKHNQRKRMTKEQWLNTTCCTSFWYMHGNCFSECVAGIERMISDGGYRIPHKYEVVNLCK